MSKFIKGDWSKLFAVIDRETAKHQPVYRTYIVTDLLTAPEGSRVGDTIEYREPATFVVDARVFSR